MSTFLSKINLGKYNKKHLGILFIVGLLLVVISIPTSSQSDEEDEEVENSENLIREEEELDYKSQMESQLTQILSQVDEVGNVEVMITLASSTTKIVEKDINGASDGTEENTVYQDNEDGQEPYVSQELYPEIEGVVVIATGGDNSIVIQNITEAVQALFDVDTHKIKIMKMKLD